MQETFLEPLGDCMHGAIKKATGPIYMEEKPHHSRLSYSEMPLEKGLAIAQSVAPLGWQVAVIPGLSPSFGGVVDFWVSDQMTAVRQENLTCRLKRSGNASEPSWVRLRLLTGGRIEGIADGEPLLVEPGDVTFESIGGDFAIDTLEVSSLSIALPISSVTFDVKRHAHFITFSGGSPLAGMLGSALQRFFEIVPEASKTEAHDASAMLAGLVTSALERAGSTLKRTEDFRDTQLASMKSFIEHELSDPELSVATLVKHFPVSRAVAYRRFKDAGGLSKYIQERRLVRSATMLAFADEGTSIGDVARSVGITNMGHFARLFRQRFDMSPTEARSAFKVSKRSDREAGSGDSSMSTGALLRTALDFAPGY